VRDAATRAGMNEQSAYSCAAGLMKRSGRRSKRIRGALPRQWRTKRDRYFDRLKGEV
jgi:hypothetical protein